MKKGAIFSLEHKKKLSIAAKNRLHLPLTEEHKKRISIAHLGKKRPDMIGNKLTLGMKHSNETKLKMSLSHIGKSHPGPTGKNNPNWKGNKVGYRSLHKWVEKWLGKAFECVYCGKNKLEKRIHWASISHKAKRDLNDYISLCVVCHKNYDKKVRV